MSRAKITLERGKHLLVRDRLEPVSRAPGELVDLFDVAQTFQRQGRLAVAAQSYAAHAAQARGDGERTRVAHYRATLLYCTLGDEERCIRYARAFRGSYGANHPRSTGELLLIGAELLDTRADSEKLLGFFDASLLEWFGNSADPDQGAHALALLARAQSAFANQTQALASFRVAVSTCSDPGSFIAAKATSTAAAVDYLMTTERIAEALFRLADAEKARADALLLPAFTGSPRNDAAVLQYVRSEMEPWAERRRLAILNATAAYKRVVDMASPVPAWTVRASARVASMWSDLSDQMRDGLPAGTLLERRGWTPTQWIRRTEIAGDHLTVTFSTGAGVLSVVDTDLEQVPAACEGCVTATYSELE